MAPFWSFLPISMVLIASHYSLLASASRQDTKLSTISAAPAVLPGASSPLLSPTLSPDITPLFPSPKREPLAPSESSLPTIPSSPSPPNPDVVLGPGPQFAFSPSGSLPASSSASVASSGYLNCVVFVALGVVCVKQLSGM